MCFIGDDRMTFWYIVRNVFFFLFDRLLSSLDVKWIRFFLLLRLDSFVSLLWYNLWCRHNSCFNIGRWIFFSIVHWLHLKNVHSHLGQINACDQEYLDMVSLYCSIVLFNYSCIPLWWAQSLFPQKRFISRIQETSCAEWLQYLWIIL